MRQRVQAFKGNLPVKVVSWSSALVLVAALGVWGFPSGPLASNATTSPSPCTTSDLVVWLNTSGNGAAGSAYYNLNFTNLSSRSCTLKGYPGVSGLSLTSTQLGSSAARDVAHAATLITLTSARSAAGLAASNAKNSATVILQMTDANNYPASTCGQVTAAGLRVYPPGQTASKVIPFPFVACSKSGPRYLHVEAEQKYVATR